jgi:fused-like protein
MLIEALAFIHGLNVAHFDIKPDNILVTAGSEVRLSDFGIAETIKSVVFSDLKGTAYFLPPERFTHHSYDPKAGDIWSLGVSLYIALVGEKPFSGNSLKELKDHILEAPIQVPAHVHPDSKAVLLQMLERDHTKRATAQMLL